jgi:hypothetical protein
MPEIKKKRQRKKERKVKWKNAGKINRGSETKER